MQTGGAPGLLVQRLGGILDLFAGNPALMVFRSALPVFFTDVGRCHLLVERFDGVLDRLGCDPAGVVITWALSAFGLELDWPGQAVWMAGGLLRAEERIQHASMIRLGHRRLVLKAMP